VDGLAAASTAALAAAADAVAADRAEPPRIALADALDAMAAGAERAKAMAVLGRLLEDASWRVRSAAYEAALLVWDKEAVPLLVAALRKETGRLRRDAPARAEHPLRRGRRARRRPLGRVVEDEGGGPVARAPPPAGPPRARPPRPGGGRRAGGPDAHGVLLPDARRVRAARVLLRLLRLHEEPRRGRQPTTKVDLARAEFEKTAKALPKETVYDVFIYRYPSGFPPAPRMTRAFASSCRAARTPRAGRPSGCGRRRCAAGARSSTRWCSAPRRRSTRSCCSPTGARRAARTTETSASWTSSARENRFRRVAVDTVLVGKKGADVEFMQWLADATGGRFTDANEALK